MKTISFTNKELEVLEELIFNSNACSDGCVFQYMQKSKKNCDECEFTKLISQVFNKIKE